VVVEGGIVTAVGPRLEATPGSELLDATDLVVAPGFIDLHTHCDFTLPKYPRADAMVRQGVTTVVTGNCGFTPFPVTDEHFGLLRDATAFLDDGLAWSWRSADDYALRLESLPLSLNVVLQVGHGSVRTAVMGFEQRSPTAAELIDMQTLVRAAMQAGCAGISSGLSYPPGSYSDAEELIALTGVAATHGGFYSTHVRDEGPALLEAVDEALLVARRSGASLQISHHKVLGRANWGLTESSLQRIAIAEREGIDVCLDQYPYTAASTTLTALLPGWALDGGIDAMRDRLRNPATRAAVRYEVLHRTSDFEPEAVFVASIAGDVCPELLGKSLLDGATQNSCEPVDLLLDLLRDYGRGVEVVIVAIGEDDIQRVMRHPRVAIASDGWTLSPAAGGVPHPRSYGTFARVLGHYVRDQGVITLENAVRKMTSLPAQRLGMTNRGVIRVGARADLVIFDPRTIVDRATYERPHQFCGGVRAVYVDGVAVVRDGEDTGAARGRVLRRPHRDSAAITG
jgi:N-acyl-D-amino-acid deacylase